SQALQRPTRAYTPPPVPAEKSSSYPRLHRSAFLFQSARRLAAPPFSGQACCLERAPLLHLLARLLAPLPGPARRCGAGGGFAREPASFPFPLLPFCCLLPPASLLRLSNSPLSPLPIPATQSACQKGSASPGKAGRGRSPPPPNPRRRRRRRGSARGAWHPALPPEQQPGNLRAPPSCGPEVERPGRGPPSTLPPSA
ncbi:hypothetical protein MC885_009238, partial [Smutsia gigantea]